MSHYFIFKWNLKTKPKKKIEPNPVSQGNGVAGGEMGDRYQELQTSSCKIKSWGYNKQSEEYGQ